MEVSQVLTGRVPALSHRRQCVQNQARIREASQAWPAQSLCGVFAAGMLQHEAFGRRMDQIGAGHDLLQPVDTRLGHFQILRFGYPDKVAVGEPFEYVEHNW